MNNKKTFSTRAIHSDLHDSQFGSLTFPIYQTSTFVFDNTIQGGNRFALEEPGFIYTRLGNPSTTALELKIASLENTEACLALSSGMGAISTVFMTLLSSGDHFITDKTLYGCTHALFSHQLTRFGIEVDFIDFSDLDKIEQYIKPNTKALYFESPCNPTLKIIDIEAVAKIAKKHNLVSIIDNTVATPYITRPSELGIDIIVHSATKYLNGHGDVIAGFICASSKFIVECRFIGQKDITGSVMSAFDAFLVNRGLKTLPLRMDKHCENGVKVANFLNNHQAVKTVYYPGLESHPNHLLAKKQMNGMYSGLISFELNGEFDDAINVLNSLKLIKLAVSLGDAESLIQHPASMTHSPYTKEERLEIGVTDTLIRLSVGLEDANDIINDLKLQLDKLI